MSTMTETEGSTLASSSMTRHAAVKDEPLPPCCSATSTPMNPASKIARISSGSISEAASIDSTRGMISSAAKRAAASRMSDSSSEIAVTLHTRHDQRRTIFVYLPRKRERSAIKEGRAI